MQHNLIHNSTVLMHAFRYLRNVLPVKMDTLYDYCDGDIYKNHPLFSTHKDALQLIIYFDEVETVNPLGSYRGYHKLGKL